MHFKDVFDDFSEFSQFLEHFSQFVSKTNNISEGWNNKFATLVRINDKI